MALYTGNIKFTATDTEPTSDKGRIYYDDSQSQLKHCDGSDWLKVNTNINYDRPGDGQYDADVYTKLLIHSNTSNDNTTFADSSSSGHSITRAGNTQHKTVQSKIGATSMYFDGSSDYLIISDSSDWAFGGDDFTIDFWIRPVADSTLMTVYSQFSIDSGSGNSILVAVRDMDGATDNEHVYLRVSNVGTDNGSNYTSDTDSLTANVWQHVAVVRNGDNLIAFVDGTQVMDITHSGTIHDSNRELWIGKTHNRSYDMYGYIDELRVSKGIARWTSDFTVY